MYFQQKLSQKGSLFVNMLENSLTIRMLKNENNFMKEKQNMGATCITSTSRTKSCGEYNVLNCPHFCNEKLSRL